MRWYFSVIVLALIAGAGCAGAPKFSLRPEARSTDQPRLSRAERRALRDGAVCGDPLIQGEFVGTVPGRIPGCGVENAVRVTSVAGVTFSQGAVMDCDTARATKAWVENGLKPAVGRHGGGVAGVKVAAHYVCRTRNHRAGAKISEHGRGRAIDISAIQLQNGDEITLLNDWGRGRAGKILRQAHSAACGPFGTVLGPESDAYHKDHFHFDTARYRSGSFCR